MNFSELRMTTGTSEPSYRVHTWPDERGRCLVATRDIAAGELVLRDEPIAFGPTSKEANWRSSFLAAKLRQGIEILLISRNNGTWN